MLAGDRARGWLPDRGWPIESMSSCQTAARALMCPSGRGTTRRSREGGGPSSADHLVADRMWVPAERDPVGEHAVPTRRGELTRAHPAVSTLAPRAAGPRPTGPMWRTCSCSAVVVARSLAERPLIRRLHYYPWRAAECLGASRSLPCQDTGGRGVWGRYEGESRHRPTVVGFVARLRCVEAGIRRVAVWPHPRVSGCGLLLLWCLCPD